MESSEMTPVPSVTTISNNYGWMGGQNGNNSWTIAWTCQVCGQFVFNSQVHVCPNQQSFSAQTIPHRCPVCEGKGRVLFNPDDPHAFRSNVEDWPCRPCGATGVLWGF